jgi:hypothetical protein
MRLPRMTTRRWMVMVGIVAIALGVIEIVRERRLASGYRLRAKFYATWEASTGDIVFTGSGRAQGLTAVAKAPDEGQKAYAASMRRKYEWAAAHPWLPVQPDPPPPAP